jgi:Na+-transporting NADH:ubiquinone oxidoreductase subunit A
LSGFQARGDRAYLGRYHQQVSVIPENTRREFLGWLRPGLHQHSVKNIVLSRLLPQRLLKFDTSTHGELRAIVPTESYEKVIPLDILPTHLLRALAVRDLDEAELLGALELDEEDLALCTYVCPSKIDHGSALRKTLSLLAKEG